MNEITPQAIIALVAYIPIAALIMAMRDTARGFSIAYLVGLMFLPAGYEFEIPVLPDLSKENAPAVGILIGTLIFHPKLLARFKITALDFIFLFGAACAFMTAMLNDMGLKFGASETLNVMLSFFLPVMLARIHIGSPKGLRTFLITLVVLACIYTPLSLFEFRMSPQLHTWTYGYFQHVFQQHMRGSFWRPIVYFYHALSLGRFYALAAFLALFPLRKDLIRRFGPNGAYLWMAPFLGLLLELSLSPILMFTLLCGMYQVVMRVPLAVWLAPLAAYMWFAGVFAQIEIGYGSVSRFSAVSSERAESFNYRLQALREYRSVVLTKPWFGWGGFGRGRIEGRATDSQLLVHLLSTGLFGAVAYFGWWWGAMGAAAGLVRRARGTPTAGYAAAFAAFASIGLSYTVVDAAVDHFMMFGLAALYGIATTPAARKVRKLPFRRNPYDLGPLPPRERALEAH